MIRKGLLLHRNARATRGFLELYRKNRRDLPGLYRQVGGAKARRSRRSSPCSSRGCEELQAFLGREPGPAAGRRAPASARTSSRR